MCFKCIDIDICVFVLSYLGLYIEILFIIVKIVQIGVRL